jgi:hypothetical protein
MLYAIRSSWIVALFSKRALALRFVERPDNGELAVNFPDQRFNAFKAFLLGSLLQFIA